MIGCVAPAGGGTSPLIGELMTAVPDWGAALGSVGLRPDKVQSIARTHTHLPPLSHVRPSVGRLGYTAILSWPGRFIFSRSTSSRHGCYFTLVSTPPAASAPSNGYPPCPQPWRPMWLLIGHYNCQSSDRGREGREGAWPHSRSTERNERLYSLSSQSPLKGRDIVIERVGQRL